MNQAQTAQLAASLLNTTTFPPGLAQVIAQAQQAKAYHALDPYPIYNFRDWKVEDRGPLPRCLPLARSIVKRGAKWLFGKPLQINCPGNEKLQKTLRDAWQQNQMDSRLVAMAEKGAIEGGIVLKFSYDETDAKKKIAFQTLSLCDQVRLYYHPHDRTCLLMARVQYSYYDAVEKKQFWYREEWTAQEQVDYQPIPADSIGTKSSPDAFENWIRDEAASKTNPFGLIPLVHIKNVETDDLWGNGDLWELHDGDNGGLYRVLDRMHLTYHLMDQSNQFDSAMNLIFLDADLDENDIDKPIVPGQPVDAKSVDGGPHPARVQEVGGKNALRPAMMEYAKDLKKQVLAAASSVEVDQAEFSNKGNLTEAVLVQLYQPQIEITDEKHKSYGTNGIEQFLEVVAQGVQAAGGDLGVSASEDSYDVQAQFADYFELSTDEKGAVVKQAADEVEKGFTTQERATKRVAHTNRVADTDALLKELGPTHARMEADRQAQSEQTQNPPGTDPLNALDQNVS